MPVDLLDVARLRLRNQRVTGAALASATEVVAWLGCAQAQEAALAKWTLGMRMPVGTLESAVDAALASGQILRTHILRPTWHYVAPADIRWITRLTGPRVLSGSAARMRFLELDDVRIGKSLDVITESLAGGKHKTRPQLQEELARRGLTADGSQMTYIVMAGEMNLVIASGTPTAKSHTYALLDEWAPPTARDLAGFDRDRALADLTLRYFTSHGPATIADFTWWSGVNGADTKRGIAANGTALSSLDVAGETFWWAGDVGGSADSPVSPTVYLMQAYDEYVVAYKSPRTPINVAGLASAAVLQRPPFYHAIIVDSQGVGFWRRLTTGSGFRVEISLLRSLSLAERAALDLEVARYAAFLGRPVSVAAASA